MPNRTFTADDLTAILDGLRLPHAVAEPTSEVTRAQVELLLTRIAALTDALRAADDNGATRLATRLMLNDLALVAAQLRARTHEVGESLERAIEGINALEAATGDPRVRR